MYALMNKFGTLGVAASGLGSVFGDYADSLTATGTTRADAFEASTAILRFTTVAAGTGVVLDNGSRGDSFFIINDGANTLKVYPPSGHSITPEAADAAYSIPAGAGASFIRVSVNRWVVGAAPRVFLQTGTGAVPVAYDDVLRVIEVQPQQFGADNTGLTDTTAELQAAATAAEGKVFHITSGTYAISAPILLPDNIEVFVEAGAVVTSATPNISFLKASGKSNIRIYGGGKLQQTGVAGAEAYVAAIELNACTDCTVEGRVEFEGFQWAGVYLPNSHRCRVAGAYMHDWLGTVDNSGGVVIYYDANDNVVENCHFKATGWLGAYVQDPGGLGTYNPQRNKIRNNRIEDTKAYGAMLYVGAAGNSENEITGNTVSGVTGAAGSVYGMGIYCVGHGLGGCKVLNNTVNNCCINQTATTNGYAGIVVTGNTPGYTAPVVTGNTVNGMTQGGGIQIISCLGGAVVGPNSVYIPAENDGSGDGGASLIGQALLVWNSNDVSVSPGNYTNAGAGPAIQLNATEDDYYGITLNIGNAEAAAASAILVTRTGAYTTSGTISGGTAKSPADAVNAMQLLGFNGPVSGIRVRCGATAAASAGLAVASSNVRFTNMDVQTTGNSGTYSVAIGAGCTGSWDESNSYNNRFENSATEFYTKVRGAAAPAVGIWAVGGIVVNTAPAASGNIGWVCTTAGAPGTWKTFGTIAA